MSIIYLRRIFVEKDSISLESIYPRRTDFLPSFDVFSAQVTTVKLAICEMSASTDSAHRVWALFLCKVHVFVPWIPPLRWSSTPQSSFLKHLHHSRSVFSLEAFLLNVLSSLRWSSSALSLSSSENSGTERRASGRRFVLCIELVYPTIISSQVLWRLVYVLVKFYLLVI